MTDGSDDAERAREAIEDIGADRLSDAIVEAWTRAGFPGAAEWPDDEPRYRVDLPAADPSAGLDALAAALDASPRSPETAAFHVAAGRRDGSGRVRDALADLAGRADVTVDDRDAAGTVSLDGEAFDALARLSEEVEHLLIRDADGVAIAQQREEGFTVALPESSLPAFRADLPDGLADRLEAISD